MSMQMISETNDSLSGVQFNATIACRCEQGVVHDDRTDFDGVFVWCETVENVDFTAVT